MTRPLYYVLAILYTISYLLNTFGPHPNDIRAATCLTFAGFMYVCAEIKRK